MMRHSRPYRPWGVPDGPRDRDNGHNRYSAQGPAGRAAAFWGYLAAMASSNAFDALPGRPTINPDLEDVADQVRHQFADRIDPGEVDECLARVAAKFDDAKVRSFVPLLVRRYVVDELQGRIAHA